MIPTPSDLSPTALFKGGLAFIALSFAGKVMQHRLEKAQVQAQIDQSKNKINEVIEEALRLAVQCNRLLAKQCNKDEPSDFRVTRVIQELIANPTSIQGTAPGDTETFSLEIPEEEASTSVSIEILEEGVSREFEEMLSSSVESDYKSAKEDLKNNQLKMQQLENSDYKYDLMYSVATICSGLFMASIMEGSAVLEDASRWNAFIQ